MWIFNACDFVKSGDDNSEQGKSYYISLQGDDTNPSTKSKPWKSISKVNETDFQPGDQILFEGGSVFEGKIVLDINDKADVKYNIIVSSFGNGRAQINAGNTEVLVANNCNHLDIKNLVFTVSGRLSGNISDGVHLVNCDSIKLSELEVYGFQHSGLRVHKSSIPIRRIIASVY